MTHFFSHLNFQNTFFENSQEFTDQKKSVSNANTAIPSSLELSKSPNISNMNEDSTFIPHNWIYMYSHIVAPTIDPKKDYKILCSKWSTMHQKFEEILRNHLILNQVLNISLNHETDKHSKI